MPPEPAKPKKFYTGVSLDREVVGYVDRLAREMGWTRSLTLNFVLREHARWHGQNVSAAAREGAQEASL
jgi:hypothetical protein